MILKNTHTQMYFGMDLVVLLVLSFKNLCDDPFTLYISISFDFSLNRIQHCQNL